MIIMTGNESRPDGLKNDDDDIESKPGIDLHWHDCQHRE